MNRLVIFVIGMVCGGGLSAGVYSSHFVQTKDNWLVVPRAGVNLNDIYADVRHWSLDDWRKHPELSRDMVKAGHAEIIRDQAVGDVLEETADKLTQRLEPLFKDTDRPAPHRAQTHRPERKTRDFDPEFAP